MRNTAEQKPITTEHGLWGRKSSSHPFHKAFKSTLCVSAAAMVISSITAKAGIIDGDVYYPNQRSNAALINETVTVKDPSRAVIGIEIFSKNRPNDVTFTNTGTIDMDYLGSMPNEDIAVTGIESVIDSSVTIDNQADIALQAENTNSYNYFGSTEAGATGIDTTGDVINSASISATASTKDSFAAYGNYVEADGIAASGTVDNSGAISVSAESGFAYLGYSGAEATGILSRDSVHNTGIIDVNAASYFSRHGYSYAEATGIEAASDITNESSGAITVSTASGGSDHLSEADAIGLYSKYGSIDNSANIEVTAKGGESYYYSGATAHGIYAEDSSVNNRGDITVMAASGSSYEESHVEAYGIYAENDIENTGDISVSATTVGGADASYADAGGLDSWDGDITNSGNITVQATAADANAVSDAEAFGISAASNIYNSGDAKAEGLVNDNGYLVNTGSITVEATSGSARKMSRASVVGISANVTVENSGAIAVTGSAADSGYIVTEVVGINTGEHPDIGDGNKRSRRPSYSGGDVLNTSAITVTSTTGDGYAIRQHAQGINAHGDVANDGAIQVTATSGSASSENFIQAMGVSSTGDVTNTGSITIASTIDYAGVSSGVKAYGIYADYDIDNSGSIDITVTTGGAKKGHNYADAQGLRADEGSIVNDATVTIKATSGQAGDVSWADAEGIDAVTDLDNSGAVRVTATSGNAGFISDAEAEGLANDDGYLANTGSITVEGTSGDAYISSASAVAIQSDSIYGVTNQGEISVSAQSGTARWVGDATASGIISVGTVVNSSSISVTSANNEPADKLGFYNGAAAHGITLRGDKGATIDNVGSVYVSAKSGQAMESRAASVGISVANTDPEFSSPSALAVPAEPTPEGRLVNSGDVTVIATSGGSGDIDDERSMSFAGATGLSANGAVENRGAIAVTGSAADSGEIETEVVGINTGKQPYLGGEDERSRSIAPSYYGGDVFNSSAITVTSTTGDGYAIRQNARAINAYGDVTNDGTIQVTATSGSAAYDNSIQAMGIYSTGDVTNSGSITVNANGGESGPSISNFSDSPNYLNGGAGIFAYDSIDNSGNITVTTSNAAMAAGLFSFYGDVTNTGNITATHGIVQVDGKAIITNEGTITVAAPTGGTNQEDPMSVPAGIMLYNGGTVHSSGLINVTADSGYQVMNTGRNVATITGFAMEFGASQEQLDARYEGCLGGNVEFGENAKLYVYAGGDMFEGVNTYLIPALLEEDADKGIERGYFADYQFATASPYYEISMSGKEEDSLQEISIEFTPEIASPQYAASVRNFMFDQMNGIVKNSLFGPVLSHMLTGDPTQISYDGVLLASTNPIPDTSSVITQTPRKKSSVFVQPFYTDTSNSSDPMGYDADIYGLTGGYNYHVNGNLIVGVHAGYGNADVDYSGTGYDLRSEDIDSISFGLHGIHRFADNWLGTATATFFHTDNDYMDQSPTNRETADYNTYGTEANIELGYIFNFGNHHIIPEIGLTYLWQHNESYTTDNLDNQDITFGSMDEHELYGRLGVSWYGNFIQEKWQIVPNLSIGLEEALTDGELSSTMSNGRTITTVESDFGDTTFTAKAGIEFSNDRYTFAAGYAGSYSSDLSDSSIFLQAVYRF